MKKKINLSNMLDELIAINEKEKLKDNRRNILLLIPLYGSVPSHSVLSLIDLLMQGKDYYNINYIVQVDLYVPFCRCRLASQALSIIESGNKIDAAFLLDQDHYFQQNDYINLIEKFCESDYDVLGAHYIYKDGSNRVVAFDFDNDDNMVFREDIKPNSGIVNVDGIGLGFCCVKPEFLQKMHYEYKGLEFMTEMTNKFVGEDVAFFKKAKKLGAKVGIDTDICVKHVGAAV